jgi:hypothetical protein
MPFAQQCTALLGSEGPVSARSCVVSPAGVGLVQTQVLAHRFAQRFERFPESLQPSLRFFQCGLQLSGTGV